MANLKMTADQAMSAMSIPAEKWEEYRVKLQKPRDLLCNSYDGSRKVIGGTHLWEIL